MKRNDAFTWECPVSSCTVYEIKWNLHYHLWMFCIIQCLQCIKLNYVVLEECLVSSSSCTIMKLNDAFTWECPAASWGAYEIKQCLHIRISFCCMQSVMYTLHSSEKVLSHLILWSDHTGDHIDRLLSNPCHCCHALFIWPQEKFIANIC